MTLRVLLRPEAEEEIHAGAEWYRKHGVGLDAAFLDEVARVVEAIRSRPGQHPIVEEDVRKAVLRRFPYIVLYRHRGEEIVLISCFHTSRDPQRWRERL